MKYPKAPFLVSQSPSQFIKKQLGAATAIVLSILFTSMAVDGMVIRNNPVPKIHAGTWTQIESMPTNSFLLSAVPYQGKLYAIGGNDGINDLSNVSIYSGYSWSAGPTLASARALAGIVNYRGLIYMVGGETALGLPSGDISTFNGTAWSAAGVLPDGIEMLGMGITVHEDCIYTMGGAFTTPSSDYPNGPRTVMVYDGTTWSQSPYPYPMQVLFPALVSFQGKLYGMGGQMPGNATNVYFFNGAGWTETSGMPKALYAMGASVLGKYLYVAGGYDYWGDYSTNVYRFDGVSWEEVDSLPAGLAAPGMATLNNSLIVAGGILASGYAVNTAYQFIPLPEPPTIQVQPADVLTLVGASAKMEVMADGSPTMRYQWRWNGTTIPNATHSSIDFEHAQFAQAGDYDVIVVNPYGSITSSVAHLTIAAYAIWGDNRSREIDTLNPTHSPVSVALGWYHTLALMSDQTVVSWGENKFGQTVVPQGLSNVVAVSAGAYHSLALKSDGTVVGWGMNWFGEGSAPAALSNVVAISAGAFHNLALKNDGTVVGWGYNYDHQCEPPAGLAGISAISAGAFHSLALRHDGTVVAWGNNIALQSVVPPGLTGVKQIAAGSYHNMALKNDGTVLGWGDNRYLQLLPPSGLNHVISIACGDSHTLALRDDGTVVSWGHNQWEQTEIPPGVEQATFIAAGGDHSVVLISQ